MAVVVDGQNSNDAEYVAKSFSKLVDKYYPAVYNEIIDGGALLIATCITLHYDCPDRQQRMKDYVNEYAKNISS